MPNPTELRAHSAYSFGDGAVTPEALVERAAELGYTALGLTDTADLGGIVRFGTACRTHNVRPVVGAELIVDGRPLALLARTRQGYFHLASLVTRSRSGTLQGVESPRPGRGRPRLTWSDVAGRTRGLQLLTGPPSGMLATLVRDERIHEATRLLHEWREQFGGHVAVEVQCHQTGADEAALAGALIALAERADVPWVVAQDPRYISRGGRLVHDMLTALRQGITLDELTERGLGHPNGDWNLLAPDVLAERWRGREAGFDASAAIAEQCGFDLSWVRPPLPSFAVPGGHDDNSFLRERTVAGAHERWGSALSEAQQRQINRELTVIGRLGFAGFFLVMWDAVHYAQQNGILCQGRGSAANSAVAYCLGITAIDPIVNGLLFERFLSEARVDGQAEAPDIDVDFEHDRREEVLDYMYAKYARTGAAITAVTQIYSGPTSLQDGMRALGYPAELAFRLSKRLHYHNSRHGAESLASEVGPSQGFDVTTPRARALIAIMRACEDLPRLRSTHPGGFVLSSAPLGDHAPIEWTTMGRSIIQFDKDDLDIVGIPKFDFLGLGGLAAVRRAFDAIEARTSHRPKMYELPIDDRATYEMISKGDTIGTFQIESRAQIASIVHTRPERLYDITVQVALIRPGPIVAKFVQPYTDRRRGREQVTLRRSAPGADSRAHPGHSHLPGTGDGDRHRPRRVHAGGSRHAAPDDGQPAQGGAADRGTGGIARAPDRESRREGRGRADRVGPARLRQLRLSGIARLEFRADRLRHGVAQDQLSHRVLPRPAQFAADGVLLGEHAAARRATTRRTVAPALPVPRLSRLHVGTGRESGDARAARRLALHPRPGHGRPRRTRGRPEGAAVLGDRRRGAARATRTRRCHRRGARRRLRGVGTRSAEGGMGSACAPRATRCPWRRRTRRRSTPGRCHATGASCSTISPPASASTAIPWKRCGRNSNGWAWRTAARSSRRANRETVVVSGLVIARQQPQTANGTVFLLLEDEHGHINVIVPKTITGKDREAMKHAMVILVLGRVERNGPVLQVIGSRFQALQVEGLTYNSRDFR